MATCSSMSECRLLSCVLFFATPRSIQSVEFSRPEYWSGQPFPSPGDLPNPGLPHCRWILYQLSHQEAQEYWSGQPIHSPADLSDPGIDLGSPALQADSLPTELSGKLAPVLLPGEFHGQRSLVGYSLQGCKKLARTEMTWHARMHLIEPRKKHHRDYVFDNWYSNR